MTSSPAAETPHPLLTVAEVAATFRISRSAVNKWIKAGVLPVVQQTKGGALRFRREDVERLLEPRVIAPTEQAS